MDKGKKDGKKPAEEEPEGDVVYDAKVAAEAKRKRKRKEFEAGENLQKLTPEKIEELRQKRLEAKRNLLQAEQRKLNKPKPEWDRGHNNWRPLTKEQEKALRDVWYGKNDSQGVFWGRDRLFKHMEEYAKQEDIKLISRRQVYSWVTKQEAYQRYKLFSPDKVVLKTIQPSKPGVIQIDYLEFGKHQKQLFHLNKKIFVAIDVFSHYAWAYLRDQETIGSTSRPQDFPEAKAYEQRKKKSKDGDETNKMQQTYNYITMKTAIAHAKKMIKDANTLGMPNWRVRFLWSDKGSEFSGIDPDDPKSNQGLTEDGKEKKGKSDFTIAVEAEMNAQLPNSAQLRNEGGQMGIGGRHYMNPTRTHAHHVERFNRTLRMLLSKELEQGGKSQPSNPNKHSEGQNKNKEVKREMLAKVIEMYNNSPHPSLKFMKPVNAIKEQNWDKVRSALGLTTKVAKNVRAPEFEVNDIVRVGIRKIKFNKADRPQYTRQLYVVQRRELSKLKADADLNIGKSPRPRYFVRQLKDSELRKGDASRYYLPDPTEISEDKSIGAFFRQIPGTPLLEEALVDANHVQTGDDPDKLYNQILTPEAQEWHKEHMAEKKRAEDARQEEARLQNEKERDARLKRRKQQKS